MSHKQRRASPFWRGLISASPVILHWLRWLPGSGTEILIGRDKIIGLDNRSILSPPLHERLSSLNLVHLSQAKSAAHMFPHPDLWLHSNVLLLRGPMASEWDAFTGALKSAGIALNGGQDTLIWAGGDASGHLTVKNVYLALLHPLALAACSPRLHSIWNWPLPLKLQLFFWMCVQGKILTWEVLRKKDWHGPSRCALCKDAAEDLHHLFVHCAFFINIWTFLKQHFSLTTDWKGSSFTDCFISWTSASSAPHSLAAHVCWQTWKERNLAVFEGRPPSLQAVLHRILSSFQLQQKSTKYIQIKARDYSIAEGSTIICFDGAAHSNGLCCGAGGTFNPTPRGSQIGF